MATPEVLAHVGTRGPKENEVVARKDRRATEGTVGTRAMTEAPVVKETRVTGVLTVAMGDRARRVREDRRESRESRVAVMAAVVWAPLDLEDLQGTTEARVKRVIEATRVQWDHRDRQVAVEAEVAMVRAGTGTSVWTTMADAITRVSTRGTATTAHVVKAMK